QLSSVFAIKSVKGAGQVTAAQIQEQRAIQATGAAAAEAAAAQSAAAAKEVAAVNTVTASYVRQKAVIEATAVPLIGGGTATRGPGGQFISKAEAGQLKSANRELTRSG